MNSRERAEKWWKSRDYSAYQGEAYISDLAAEFDAVRAEARREALEEAIEIITYMPITHGAYRPDVTTLAECRYAIRALKEKKP